jgi:hypothetical protein
MGAILAKLFNKKVASGNWNGDAAGTDKNGATLSLSIAMVSSLAAHVVVEAETDTLTITGRWEVSNDDSTWYTIVPSNNAANVILATGTAGADTPVTRVVVAPDQIYGYRYARYTVTNGVATGATTDTYAIGYSFIKRSAATAFGP